MSGARIRTDRLLLREVSREDAYAFRDFMTEEAYWRRLPIDPPTLSSIRAYLEQCHRDSIAEPRVAWSLAAVEVASGQILGEGSLRVLSWPWRQGEIGWGVAPDRSGEGHGSEIAAAMLRLAFDELGLHRVVARCRADNAASRRIMAKLGLREEGMFRDDVLARGAWWSSARSWKANGAAKDEASRAVLKRPASRRFRRCWPASRRKARPARRRRAPRRT